MKSHLLDETAGQRTFALVFDAGDEPLSGIRAFAEERGLAAASLSGLGAFQAVTLGYFDIARRDYRRIAVEEQVEVLALIGNIARADGDVKVHAHVVVGKADGTAHGGHLLEARVRPTLEVVLVESPAHLRRRTDPRTGLALIELPAG